MIFMRHRSSKAFTLIEVLVVITIIAILAGLIVGLANRAGETKRVKRTEAMHAELVTAIVDYQQTIGSYPPDNPNNAAQPPLFYELTGTVLDGSDFKTKVGNERLPTGDVPTFFGRDGFQNASLEAASVKSFFKQLKPDRYGQISTSPSVQLFVVGVQGPSDVADAGRPGKTLNPWRYVSTNPTNNPEGFDLWAEITVGGKTKVIGNWKGK